MFSLKKMKIKVGVAFNILTLQDKVCLPVECIFASECYAILGSLANLILQSLYQIDTMAVHNIFVRIFLLSLLNLQQKIKYDRR